MGDVQITVVGTKDVQAALEKFGIKAKGAQAEVIKAAGELVRQAIADKAEGTLKDNIVAEESPDNTADGPFVVQVGPAEDPAFWAHFIEFGTRNHPIKRKTKMLKYGSDDYAARIEHPGTTARPFIRPAFDENVDQAIEKAAAEFKGKLNL